MPYKKLQAMLDAYHQTIGEPFAGWQIADVLRVFDYCARAQTTWQKEVCTATGVSSSKVNRIIDVASAQGWIDRPHSRTSDAKKPLQVTAKGSHVIAEFKRLSREAVGAKSRTVPAGGKKSLRSRIAESQSRSEELFPDD